MKRVVALVDNLLVETGNLDPRFLPAIAPLCFSGELTLESGNLLLALGKVLVVRVLYPIGGDGKRFQAHVKTGHRPGGGQRVYLDIRAAQGDKIFPAGVLADRCRQDAAFDFLADAALHKAELRELYRLVQRFDIRTHAFAFVASPAVMLAFESGIAGFPALLHPSEEILIGGVQ